MLFDQSNWEGRSISCMWNQSVISISLIRTFVETGRVKRPVRFLSYEKTHSDIDILCHYFHPAVPTKVSSFGSLSHFRRSSKPVEAGTATRCLQCPYERKCAYSAWSCGEWTFGLASQRSDRWTPRHWVYHPSFTRWTLRPMCIREPKWCRRPSGK